MGKQDYKPKQDNKPVEFVNPFKPGVSYDKFIEAKGNLSIKEYSKDHLTSEQIEWLENDLQHYTK